MSAAAVLECRASAGRPTEAGREPDVTLERLIVEAWRELGAGREASCPLCGGALTPRYGAHWRPVGGRCADCGTGLE
jgi:hypothetical protein